MPRYFFNVHDGVAYPDLHGEELQDLDAARDHAVRYAGELLQSETRQFWNHGSWAMDVMDDAGLLVFTLRFSAHQQPAAERERYRASE